MYSSLTVSEACGEKKNTAVLFSVSHCTSNNEFVKRNLQSFQFYSCIIERHKSILKFRIYLHDKLFENKNSCKNSQHNLIQTFN